MFSWDFNFSSTYSWWLFSFLFFPSKPSNCPSKLLFLPILSGDCKLWQHGSWNCRLLFWGPRKYSSLDQNDCQHLPGPAKMIKSWNKMLCSEPETSYWWCQFQKYLNKVWDSSHLITKKQPGWPVGQDWEILSVESSMLGLADGTFRYTLQAGFFKFATDYMIKNTPWSLNFRLKSWSTWRGLSLQSSMATPVIDIDWFIIYY